MEKSNNKLEIQNFNSMEELYNSIDEKGSLGLLALGAIGVLMWRKKREEIKKKHSAEENEK